MEWSSVLVYPIYVLQCLHAIVDTMSIIRKPQRFWYLVIRYHHELPCTLNSVVFELSFYLLFLKSIMMTLWVCSFGDDLDHDQWSKTTHMVHQSNRWIRDQRGFISSFDAPWCTSDLGSLILIQITPKKIMHPSSLLNFLLNKTSR